MKAWVLHGVNDIRYEDMARPAPDSGEVLVRVKAAGICGSDIPRVFVTGAHRHPLIIGHEFAGVVEELGEGTDPAWLGRRVGVFPLVPCGACGPCREKQFELCRNYRYLGSSRDGGFAEYVRVPERNLLALPEGVSFEEAAMLEPMAVAVHAMRRGTEGGTLPRNAAVTVWGLGAIGLLLTMFLWQSGYRNLRVVGNRPAQKERAMSLGVSEEQYFDAGQKAAAGNPKLFFECVGKNETVARAVESAGPNGRILLVGNPASDMALSRDTYWKILRSQLTLSGTWNSSFTGTPEDDWHYVLEQLEEGKVSPSVLITHRLPLADLEAGLSLMRGKTEDYCKVMAAAEW